jgi:hypothetical protein
MKKKPKKSKSNFKDKEQNHYAFLENEEKA